MHDVICAGCRKRFKAKSPRRKWCTSTCRTRNKRAPIEAAAGTAAGKPTPQGGDGPLVDAVTKELEGAGALESVDGQIAVVLARQVVVAKGSAVATLTRDLRAAVNRATGAAPPTPTPTSEEPVAAADPGEPDELERARRRIAEMREAAAG